MAINFNKVEFILSAASEKQFVRDGMPQLAFAGRSNVGKSSVINRLVNRKNFARVGASPGKTSQINYFKIDGKLYLVDLPGYGYAKVSKTERDRWGKLMESYFQSAGLIHLGVQIVDARHKPTADDVTMLFAYIGKITQKNVFVHFFVKYHIAIIKKTSRKSNSFSKGCDKNQRRTSNTRKQARRCSSNSLSRKKRSQSASVEVLSLSTGRYFCRKYFSTPRAFSSPAII